ncbi:MAG: hypothetical protein IT580_21215 [Verrucomicrobiales bacterium]|nr:hypothetical protein [Verrucomicrobiales bacterium]
MKLSVIIVPLMIILGGIVTFIVVPLDYRLRTLILLGDFFAAVVIFLVLLRTTQR